MVSNKAVEDENKLKSFATFSLTQSSIVPILYNENQIILGLTLGHLDEVCSHRPPLVVCPTPNYLQSQVSRPHLP